MGTYLHARLKKRDEATIKEANLSIQKAGYPSEIHNNVLYGFFTSREQLKEDARFMSEDLEGLKQAPHLERPITADFLSQWFWNEIGCGVIKLSSISDDDFSILKIINKWIHNEGKKFIDFNKSENITDLLKIIYL